MASSNTPHPQPSTTSATAEGPGRHILHSPPRRKERRNPSVTPRRFARFFGTPLGQGSSQHGFDGGYSGSSRVALGDADGSIINSQPTRVKRKLFDNGPSTSTPSLPPPEPLTKRARSETNAHPFSDENIPALGHRWQACDFAEVFHIPCTPGPSLPGGWLTRDRMITSHHLHACPRALRLQPSSRTANGQRH